MTTATATAAAAAAARPTSARSSAGRSSSVLPEFALTLLTLAAAMDLSRLFRTPLALFVPVACTAIGVHLVVAAIRRSGLGLGVAALTAAFAGVLILSWTVLPSHTAFGLPTRDTWRAANDALSAAMTQFRSAAPPTANAPGFVLACGGACGLAAFLADLAAFRMRATTEACLPSLSLFVFSAALAQGHGAVAAAAVWLTALLFFLLVREAGVDQPRAAWFASRSVQGPLAVLHVGILLTAGTVLIAVVIGPRLPGATSHSLVGWRHSGGGGGGRTTVSPLVNIRARITSESTAEVFTVTTNAPYYWRLTSLDAFDGSGWSSSYSYGRASGPLPNPPPSGPTVVANFSVTALSSIWLPAPYRPVRYTGPGKVSFSREAGSLISDQATTDGMKYTVQSVLPIHDAAALQAAPAPADDRTLKQDLSLPPLPAEVAAAAADATAGATTAYEKAVKLEMFFRNNFTYNQHVPADDSPNAIVDFLRQRQGFCQQFAATYAAMARILGLPTRVAVGFTPGNLEADGAYHVLGLHAHAWPEVYFGRIGWVPFEPTPGRGIPGAQQYTGVPEQQANQPPANTVTTAPNTPITAPGPNPTTSPRPRLPADGTLPRVAHGRRSFWGWVRLTALWFTPLLLLAITPLVRWARRFRRRASATTPASQVMLAWDEARAELALIGARPHASDTPSEYAERTLRRTRLPEQVGAALTLLADEVVLVSYAGMDPDVEAATRAGVACETVVEAAVARQTRGSRVINAVDPRQLWR